MPAIAHQNKILGNTSGGGSTILVTTSESTLYGQTVTLSDGTTTLTGTFSNAGECEFTGVMMVGTLTAASGTASTSINVPYFGVYSIILSLFSATITATYPEDKGATCTCTGNGESYTASGSPYTFTVHGAGEYRVTATLDGKSITDVIQITTDGQSETATINFGTIVVTYDNAFRGLPITCTKDSSVYTKTAPSSGNTMYFYPNITGNWVISGTVSGTSYSKTANVTSLSTSVSVSLETVPDGKTTTPTDDIEKWLQCGQITGKSYTTLSQVLADAETYERLLSDSNACDYMKRSTTWAVAEGQVPVMTSDTTPSGECIASSDETGNEPYKAFDNDNSTFWNAGVTFAANTHWVGYKFSSPTKISRVGLFPRLSTGAASNIVVSVRIEARNTNDATWTTIVPSFNFSHVVKNASDQVEVIKDVSAEYTTVSYDECRVFYESLVSGASYGASMAGIQFYEADITTSQDAMMRLGKYDYACYVLRDDNTWNTAINNSAYASYIPASPTGQTNIIVTAHGGDTVYYMENGSPVTLTTADSDTGIGTVDWSDLPKGAITLYSSTAKNPSDLTADYSKTVYVTEYTTQIYLMPDNALYWYGCHKVPMNPYNYGISGREIAKAPTVTDGTYVVTLAQSEAYLYTGCYATTLPVNLSGASNLKAHITTVTGYDNLSSSLNSVKLETTQTLQDNYTVTASGTICTLANRSTETKTDQSGSCDVSSLLSPQYCLVTLWGKLTASLDYIILE